MASSASCRPMEMRRIRLYLLLFAIYAAGLLWAGTGATKPSAVIQRPVTPKPTAPSIYWGAYVEGQSTYSSLLGGSWGNAPWDTKTVDRFERDAGKRMSIEHYGQPPPWEQPFDPGTARLVVRRGAIPAIDVSTGSTSLTAIAQGKYDDSIAAWGRGARDFGYPFFLLFDEEMNGTWYPWSAGQNGNTPADLIAAWRHVHDVVAAQGATNVTWVWCPNVDPFKTFTPYADLYPGSAYVDWTCMNGYNWGRRGWLSFNQVFRPSYRTMLAVAPGKPIMIGEVSSDEQGGSKAAWIADALGRQLPHHYPQIKAVLWFNWRIHEDGQWWPWHIESSRKSQLAFEHGIDAPYYASGGALDKKKSLSKVEPLR
jgi:Glycosyl hydrolase family 26